MTEPNEPAKPANPAISCKPNGPLIVTGPATLKNSKGEEIPTKRVIALCRCGGSQNKPFCDGTHSRNGFSGENAGEKTGEKAGESQSPGRDEYGGTALTVLDARGVCAHVGACTDGLSAVFLLGKEPWIDADGAEAEAVIEAVRNCPSGALAYAIEGAEQAHPKREHAITVTKNGPYAVVGTPDFQDETTGQSPFVPQRYALCRCGHSKNKPFCDGSHWSVEFKDDRN